MHKIKILLIIFMFLVLVDTAVSVTSPRRIKDPNTAMVIDDIYNSFQTRWRVVLSTGPSNGYNGEEFIVKSGTNAWIYFFAGGVKYKIKAKLANE